MRVIGMLGGMSWESTAEYYRVINQQVQQRLGGVHSARLLLDSLDFADIEELQTAGQWDRAGEILATKARGLERSGADLVVLCTNTMHKLAGAIERAVSIPLLHIGDATAAAIRAAGFTRVGLLGTAFTMEQDFYRDRIAAHGIQTLTPPQADRTTVHRVIYDELVRGVAKPESRAAYAEIIARLVDAGAQGIILGCTEIELLVRAEDSPVPVFATTRIHAEAAVEAALATATSSDRAGRPRS
ncbi:MAG: aspartate/glutamate racemase family protein [Arachnia sp.]